MIFLNKMWFYSIYTKNITQCWCKKKHLVLKVFYEVLVDLIKDFSMCKITASAFTAEEVNEQDKKLCVTPVQTAVMEAPHPQTVLMGLPHAQTAENLPVCDICHLPRVYDIYWLGSPTTASTALVSPTSPTETQTSSPTTWSLMMEQPEPPAYPQLPSSPCTNIWTM